MSAETRLRLDQIELGNVSLMDGERMDSALSLDGEAKEFTEEPDCVLLTDRRVIRVRGNGARRRAEFASLVDIDTVETVVEREGRGMLLWAALAFVIAVVLILVIDQAVGRIVAPLIVAFLGVYLIVDHVTSPGKPFVIFNAGSAQIRCEFRTKRSPEEISVFINRLFQLKSENGLPGPYRPDRFAPRCGRALPGAHEDTLALCSVLKNCALLSPPSRPDSNYGGAHSLR